MLQCERSLTPVQLLQCDQIGRFLKALGDKFFSKTNPNVGIFPFWVYLQIYQLSKNYCGDFWGTFGIIWATFAIWSH